MEELRNEEGKIVLPESQYDPLDPVNGAVYMKEEQFEAFKASRPADNPKVESTLPGQEQPGDTSAVAGADPLNPGSSATLPEGLDYDAIIKAKSGGKFEKWEQIEGLLSQDAKPPVLDLDETSAKIIEHLKQGNYAEVSTFLAQQQVLGGLDKLSDAEVLKMKMGIENPDFSDEDIEDEYEQKYGIGVDKEDVDEKEYTKLQRRVERKQAADAKAAREGLGALKADLKLPDLPGSQSSAAAQATDPETEKFINEFNTLGDQFSQGVQNTLPQLTKLDLSINDKDVQFAHEYSINEMEKADLGNKAKDYWSYLQSRYYKDGQYDTQKYLKDIFIIENFQKILKSAVTRANNQGKIGLARGVANVTDQQNISSSTDFAADARRAGLEDFALR